MVLQTLGAAVCFFVFHRRKTMPLAVQAHRYTAHILSHVPEPSFLKKNKILAKVVLPSKGTAESKKIIFERVPFCRIKFVKRL